MGHWLLVKEVVFLGTRVHHLLEVLICLLVALYTCLAAKRSELAERSFVFNFFCLSV